MEAIIKTPEPFPISPEEREWIEQRRQAAADRQPMKLADLTPAKLNPLSRADQQKILERIMAGEVE